MSLLRAQKQAPPHTKLYTWFDCLFNLICFNGKFITCKEKVEKMPKNWLNYEMFRLNFETFFLLFCFYFNLNKRKLISKIADSYIWHTRIVYSIFHAMDFVCIFEEATHEYKLMRIMCGCFTLFFVFSLYFISFLCTSNVKEINDSRISIFFFFISCIFSHLPVTFTLKIKY